MVKGGCFIKHFSHMRHIEAAVRTATRTRREQPRRLAHDELSSEGSSYPKRSSHRRRAQHGRNFSVSTSACRPGFDRRREATG